MILTLASEARPKTWSGRVGLVVGVGAGMGVARRVAAADTGVAMTMPVRAPGACWVLAEMAAGTQGWPLTMRTWWMGPAEEGREEAASLVVSIKGRCSSWGAAIMGGGGAGAMGTLLLGVAGLGRTWVE